MSTKKPKQGTGRKLKLKKKTLKDLAAKGAVKGGAATIGRTCD